MVSTRLYIKGCEKNFGRCKTGTIFRIIKLGLTVPGQRGAQKLRRRR